MIYNESPVAGTLVRKVNRFLCETLIDGKNTPAHIPNSGRLAELMIPGVKILLSKSANPERKTAFTLRSVWHKGAWVCVDSTVPNRVAEEMALSGAWPVFKGCVSSKREVTIGHHRFDMALERTGQKPMIVEVKSVTLVRDGVALFPNAPTERGRSHLEFMTKLVGEGYDCAALFIIGRRDAVKFSPNTETDPAFAEALRQAKKAGVQISAVTCRVGKREITPDAAVPVEL